jgi:hypothetical protein
MLVMTVQSMSGIVNVCVMGAMAHMLINATPVLKIQALTFS